MDRPMPMDDIAWLDDKPRPEPEPEPEPEPASQQWTHMRGVSVSYSSTEEKGLLLAARTAQAERTQALVAAEREARAALESQRQASERDIVSVDAQLSHLQQELNGLDSASVADARQLAATTGAKGATHAIPSHSGRRKRVLTLRGAQSGWMQKLAGGVRIGNKWQRRWFVLDNARLTYFDDEKKGTLKGTVDMSNCTRVSPAIPAYVDDVERQYEIEVELSHRTYRFRCDNKEEFDHWLRALQKGREDPVLLTATAAKCSVRTHVWLADARDASRRLPLSTVAQIVTAATGGPLLDELAVWTEGMREWLPMRILVDQQSNPKGMASAAAGGASAVEAMPAAPAKTDRTATGGFVKVNSDRLGSRCEMAIELKMLQELARRGAAVSQPESFSIHVSAAEPIAVETLATKLLVGEAFPDCSIWTVGMDSWIPIHTLLRTMPVITGRMPSIADIDRLGEELAHSLDRYVRTSVPVTLHVYDLAHSRALSGLNSRALGAFHVAVEVYGYEWSYGWNEDGETGVFACEPKQCEMHTYRESISMGTTTMSREQVNTLLDKLEPAWLGEDYDMTARNCCHFCREFSIGLGVGEIPRWLYRLADAGAAVEVGLESVATGWRSITAKLAGRVGSRASDE